MDAVRQLDMTHHLEEAVVIDMEPIHGAFIGHPGIDKNGAGQPGGQSDQIQGGERRRREG